MLSAGRLSFLSGISRPQQSEHRHDENNSPRRIPFHSEISVHWQFSMAEICSSTITINMYSVGICKNIRYVDATELSLTGYICAPVGNQASLRPSFGPQWQHPRSILTAHSVIDKRGQFATECYDSSDSTI